MIYIFIVIFSIVVLHTLFTFVFYHYENQHLSIGKIRYLKAFMGEVFYTFFIVLCFPLGFLPYPKALAKGPPIVFLHGYSMNRSYWFLMYWRLRFKGYHNLHVLNLKPFLGSITDISKNVQHELKHIGQQEKVIIIAHSMGGLVARHAALHGAPIAEIITLGTPHLGTKIAIFGRGHNARDMQPQSLFLQDLQLTQVPLTSLYSTLDNIILPTHSAAFNDAIAFEHVGHNALVFDAKIFKQVEKLLHHASTKRSI